jgi:uncharacterized protein YmfQ (DUF2313 family)/photosystem II stability/assembly factor-like uncharacterized protein
MAIVDRHGHAEAGVQGVGDVTHRRFDPVVVLLLPRGPAWDPENDLVLKKVVAALATELSRVEFRGRKLQRELDPATTFECLTDWEESYGLPDCAQPETLEARRAAILAKLLAQLGHDQSEGWWAEALGKLGYEPVFVHGYPGMTCIDDCLDELLDEEFAFVWKIIVNKGLDDALLVCFVQHNALDATLAVVHFLWSQVVVPEPANLYGVACAEDGFVSAVGGAAVSLRAGADYDKLDGTGWSLGTPDPDDIEDLFAVAAIGTVFVACGVNVNFYRSTDHGATWLSTDTATAEMYAITQGIGDGVAVAAGDNGTCWRSFDFGASWSAGTTITGNPTIQGLTQSGDGVMIGGVLACATNGHIYRTPNSGTAWTDVHTAPKPLYGIGAWELVAVAVGDDGTIARSVDGGLTFAAVASPTTTDLRAVAGTPSGRWVAAGLGGVILLSIDNGVTWVNQPSPTTEDLRAVTRHVHDHRRREHVDHSGVGHGSDH